ncbi:tRNA lysidine(34) synthetase TilS [Vibrio profundum]|uniref:tRNA lysidine(34) synthetase TilS n=1 Tax=Vibrio profundum TaxID=2910247 RepID=UPI003D0D3E5D
MKDLYRLFCEQVSQVRRPSGQLVLALSGGMDSRVLLDLMARYRVDEGISCQAVYVNHGLSPNAVGWGEQCQQWCQEYGIPLSIEMLNLDISTGDSIEQEARQGRYTALQGYLLEGDILLTGQHGEDQIETLLLALKRGSGPKGLSAMAACKPFSAGYLLRPLLACTKADIEHYAHTQQLQWVEDESNQDQRFDRNFLRHEVTPALIQRWPGFHQAVQRSATLCAEQEALLNELLAAPFEQALQADLSLSVAVLDNCSERARWQLLRMWFAHLGLLMPSQVQLKQVWENVALARSGANPSVTLTYGQVRRFEQRLFLVADYADVSDWQHEMGPEQALTLPDGLGQIALQSSNTGQLGLTKAQLGKLRITFDPEGLSAHPVERKHSRKLKKLFQEYAVPSWLRRRTPILMCGDQLVAVADLFVDKAFQGQDYQLIWHQPKTIKNRN